METLDLECPSCGEMLELDAGFAGGVCRCSSCGTLMTVPSDAGQAETLSRPEPGEASVRAGIAGGESPRQRPDGKRSSSKRGKKGKGKGKGRHAVVKETTIEAGEYRTATGKVVKLDEAVRVPMAQGKKKKIQAVTAIVFFSIILAVVGLAIFAIVAMVGGPGEEEEGGGQEQVAVPTYDGGANPFDLEFANLGGIPLLDDDFAVVIDTTARENGRWMPQATDLVTAGLDGEAGSAKISFFAADENGATSFGRGDMERVSRVSPDDLSSWFSSLSFSTDNDMSDAIQAALGSSPDALVLIVGNVNSSEIDRWSALLDDEDIAIHVLVINGFPRTIQGWLRERGGSIIRPMSAQDIENWEDYAQTPSE